jgi:hypothetical protein
MVDDKERKLVFVSVFHYELQLKQFVTIFGREEKDRVFVMEFVMAKLNKM